MRMKMKSVIAVTIAMCAAVCAVGCGGNPPPEDNGQIEEPNYSHEFTEQVKNWTTSKNSKFNVSYATATAVYCNNPTHPGMQSVAIYSPVDYLNDDGSVNKTARVGDFTAETAPMIYWNSSGSYIGMGPFTINGNSTRATQYGWVLNMIKEGFVVCMAGERGKVTTDSVGNVIGRGPIAISDLKAGVRFLKHNDDVIPGSSDRIVSVGTSSGGSMSALLGASGNCEYYEKYLEEMGACMDETDDVFATQAYCPITDLAHADYAYEWMWGVDVGSGDTALNEFQQALSARFAAEYVTFINSLGLKDENGNDLVLAADGSKSGSYYEWLIKKYEAAFEDYAKNFETSYKDYASYADNGAEDANTLDWLAYDSATGKASLIVPKDYDNALDALILSGYRPRQKRCPSFDSLEPEGTDNDVFGRRDVGLTGEGAARHFNSRIAEIIAELKDDFPEEYEQYYQTYYDDSHNEEVSEWAVYLNSYSFLLGDAESDISPFFRINMGVQDADTSCMVSSTLDRLLAKNGIDSQFNLVWGWGHNDVDTPTGLCDWVKSICSNQ